MSNMSYCRFENTLADLYECYQNWDDTDSQPEQEFRQRLLDLCKRIVADYGEGDEC